MRIKYISLKYIDAIVLCSELLNIDYRVPAAVIPVRGSEIYLWTQYGKLFLKFAPRAPNCPSHMLRDIFLNSYL